MRESSIESKLADVLFDCRSRFARRGRLETFFVGVLLQMYDVNPEVCAFNRIVRIAAVGPKQVFRAHMLTSDMLLEQLIAEDSR